MALSEAQARAVAHKDGPALVLAGPGSGKTTVITWRTRRLVEACGIAPIHILVVTFTKAAAAEMQKRFLELTGGSATQVRFGTFHAVFYEILKNAYRLTAANIAGEDAKYAILKEVSAKERAEVEDEAEFLHDLAQEISLVKNECIPLDHYYASCLAQDAFRAIFTEYQKRMREARLLDYDDLMLYTKDLFEKRPDILEGWRRRYQYILVDEFQDINRLQYDIVKMLAAPLHNLFVVGDDDQSIYRFRGAKPEIMLGFPKEYPKAARYLLDCNFRCPGNVIDLAGRLIAHNRVRFPKEIQKVKPDGEPVAKWMFPNPAKESLYLVQNIQKAHEAGRPYQDFAVLYRSNTDAIPISQKLLEYNIPFAMRDTLPNLFDHWISRQVAAYLRIGAGSRSRDDFLLICNRPLRYLERACFDQPQVSLERVRRYYDDKYWMVKRINQLERDIRALSLLKPYDAVRFVRHGIGYEKYLEEYAEKRHIKAEDLLEVLDRLEESAKDFADTASWFAYMEEYAKMLKEQAAKERTPRDAVTLTTYHSAKGLEFPVVYLIDVNEGIVPYKKATTQSDIEEERRMFYVAITRASERLAICVIREKNGKAQKPSPFLKDI